MQTFVVRVWTPPAGPEEERPDALKGVVEHLGSGHSQTFKDDAGLLSILHEELQERAGATGAGGEDAP